MCIMASCYYLLNNIAHYLLILILASLYLQHTKLGLADGLPSVKSCIGVERQALLSFKQHLPDPSGRLSSWVGHDCCRWRGISCNNRTGHVAKMDLRNINPSSNTTSLEMDLQNTIPSSNPSQDSEYEDFNEQSSLGGKLNPSLLSLKHLYYLDLSENDFQGIEIPKFFGQLKGLRYLNLSSNSFVGEIPCSFGNLSNLNYLDLSLNDLSSRNLNCLSHLTSIKYLNLGGLDLGSNRVSWLHVINMLPSLSELHLSNCQISENLPLSLKPIINFTSLLVLDMSRNYIYSSFPSWVFNLTSLRKLDLSSNSFSGPIPGEFASLNSLEHLDLSSNSLEGHIPKLIGNPCKLKSLSLAQNRLDGGIRDLLSGFSGCTHNKLESLDLSYNMLGSEWPTSLGMLPNLRYLDLEGNSFWGSIPESIGNLSFLKALNLRANRLNGSIPESLGQLSELVNLDLSSNLWEGMLTEAHFINLTRLESFAVGTEQPMSMSLIFNVTKWVPPFKLHTIEMNNCQVGPAFPIWLQSQTQLSRVILSNAGISDTIPEEWLLKISSQLDWMDLSHNQIHGKLPFPLQFPKLDSMDLSYNQLEGPLPHWTTIVTSLDLRSNSFSGPIPSNFDQLFPELRYLYLSENHLNGTIPPSICNMQSLFSLSLRGNQLSGEFPQAWSAWQEIVFIDVANNNLWGKIPCSMGAPSSLQTLVMNNNSFGGEIPSCLQNCSLETIDLGGNKFGGGLPLWIGSTESPLTVLQLRSNFLSGHITQKLCNLSVLHILDLSHNNLSGTIPKCLSNLTSLTNGNFSSTSPYATAYAYISQTTVISKGRANEYDSLTLDWVRSFDLSSNNLEGEIPEEISSLIGLGTLNLSMNQLSGDIPSKIGNLRWLETLDLSHNHLSGQIPQSFSSFTFLAHLNLSYNNLTGRIPSSTQLQTLDDSSIYAGNPSLCGVPLLTLCPGDNAPARPTNPAKANKGEDDNAVLCFYVSTVLGFIIGFWGVCGTLIVKRSWRYAYFRFFDNIKDKVALFIALKVAHWQP